MKVAVLVVRILMGLLFLFAGAMKIFPFMHVPTPAGDQGVFMSLMIRHGWFPFYGVFELVGGLMLVVGRFVPLGLTLLGAVGVNILLINATLEPSSLPIALMLAALELFLVWAYRDSFAGIFTANAKPMVGKERGSDTE